MDEIYSFLMEHKSENIRVAFDIPDIWPDSNSIMCRVTHGRRRLRRDFILTPAELPYISYILSKAYEEIMNNSYVDDLCRFSIEKGENDDA